MSSTRQKLIQLLSETNNEYISGQYLSEVLHISRSAIWKHMNELKKDGYIIDAQAKKGYRITGYPNKLSENTLSWGLKTSWLGHQIVHKQSIPSTQRLAHDLAQDGAKHGTIVVADEQTTGKGRMGRTWHSEMGQTISLSMILRPNLLPYLTPQLTLLTATVVADVVSKMTHVPIQIKWPNDLLINGKKVTGILTEMQAEQDHVQYVIIGIGMNVNQSSEDLAEEVQSKATSLYLESNKQWDIVSIIQEILCTFEQKYMNYLEEGFHQVKKTWENYGFRINEYLHITTGNNSWQGKFLGIAEDGALIAKRKNGEIEKVYSAEITWF